MDRADDGEPDRDEEEIPLELRRRLERLVGQFVQLFETVKATSSKLLAGRL